MQNNKKSDVGNAHLVIYKKCFGQSDEKTLKKVDYPIAFCAKFLYNGGKWKRRRWAWVN